MEGGRVAGGGELVDLDRAVLGAGDAGRPGDRGSNVVTDGLSSRHQNTWRWPRSPSGLLCGWVATRRWLQSMSLTLSLALQLCVGTGAWIHPPRPLSRCHDSSLIPSLLHATTTHQCYTTTALIFIRARVRVGKDVVILEDLGCCLHSLGWWCLRLLRWLAVLPVALPTLILHCLFFEVDTRLLGWRLLLLLLNSRGRRRRSLLRLVLAGIVFGFEGLKLIS